MYGFTEKTGIRFQLYTFNFILKQMISYKHRFHGHNSLRYVYSHGKTVRSSIIAVRTAENSHRSLYRCAVVVSKKISKSAVKRNRMRRRLYEIVRKNQDQLTVSADIVITVYSDEVATIPNSELEPTLLKLLAQAGVLSSKKQ